MCLPVPFAALAAFVYMDKTGIGRLRPGEQTSLASAAAAHAQSAKLGHVQVGLADEDCATLSPMYDSTGSASYDVDSDDDGVSDAGDSDVDC